MTWKSASRHALIDGDLELFLLPRPQPIRPQEHHARLALPQPLGQVRLKLPPWQDLPDLQIQLQPFPPQPPGQFLDSRAVLGVVGQERMVALRHGG